MPEKEFSHVGIKIRKSGILRNIKLILYCDQFEHSILIHYQSNLFICFMDTNDGGFYLKKKLGRIVYYNK